MQQPRRETINTEKRAAIALRAPGTSVTADAAISTVAEQISFFFFSILQKRKKFLKRANERALYKQEDQSHSKSDPPHYNLYRGGRMYCVR